MPIQWKMINIDSKQVEAIERLLKEEQLGKYSFKSVPDFIAKAITFYINYLEQELEG